MSWLIGNIMPDAIGIKYANHGVNLDISYKIILSHLGSQTPRNPPESSWVLQAIFNISKILIEIVYFLCLTPY